MVNRKGFSVIPAILIILIAAVALYSADLTWKWGEAVIKRSDVVFHSYAMEYALRSAKLYMNVSMDYAAYQACYETLNTVDPTKSEDEFRQAFELSIKEKLNIYTRGEYRYLTDYKVNIFDYDSVNIESLNPLSVNATGKDMSIRHDDEMKKISMFMEKNSSLEKTIPIDCYGIYNKGKEVSLNMKSSAGDRIKNAVSSWPTNSSEEPDEVKREDEIRSIDGLEFDWKDEGNYQIKSELEEVDVSITYTENKATGKFEGISYDVTVKMKIRINDKRDDQIFPVYDGEEIRFLPIGMEFVLEIDEEGNVQIVD